MSEGRESVRVREHGLHLAAAVLAPVAAVQRRRCDRAAATAGLVLRHGRLRQRQQRLRLASDGPYLTGRRGPTAAAVAVVWTSLRLAHDTVHCDAMPLLRPLPLPLGLLARDVLLGETVVGWEARVLVSVLVSVVDGLVVVGVLVGVRREYLRWTDRWASSVLVAGAEHVVLQYFAVVLLVVATGTVGAQVRR